MATTKEAQPEAENAEAEGEEAKAASSERVGTLFPG